MQIWFNILLNFIGSSNYILYDLYIFFKTYHHCKAKMTKPISTTCELSQVHKTAVP